ncbi:MAG: hypothetical protein N4A72_05925 [Bacteroidales bacterium]|nr:hypothetical protein [Bacteroidales bacterium]
MRKLIFALIALLWCIYPNLYSQNGDDGMVSSYNHLMSTFPVHPDAANLGKFGNLPVNMSSGTLNNTVPLIKIKVGDKEIPLMLSYNYSGLKVDAVSGSVGLGWTLVGGGVITRNIRGKADELSDKRGYLWNANLIRDYYCKVDGNCNDNPIDINDFIKKLSLGSLDGEPDIFFMNGPGINTRFAYNYNKEIVTIDNCNYKIDNPEILNYNINNAFTITDDVGDIYNFSKMEITSNETQNILGGGVSPSSILSETPYTSAWHLTELTDKSTGGVVSFKYDKTYAFDKISYNESLTTLIRDKSTINCLTQNPEILSKNRNITKYRKPLLTKISTNTDDVELIYSDDNSRLTEVNLYSNGDFVYGYRFEYENLESSGALFVLTNIYKVANDNVTRERQYTFDYHKSNLPDITTEQFYFAQDMWGFYNGSYNSSLIDFVNSHRMTNMWASLTGSLKTIIYPTGGLSEIEYEQNNEFGNINRYAKKSKCAKELPLNSSLELKVRENEGCNYDRPNCMRHQDSIHIKHGHVGSLHYTLRVIEGLGVSTILEFRKRGSINQNRYSLRYGMTECEVLYGNYYYDQQIGEELIHPDNPETADGSVSKTISFDLQLDSGKYDFDLIVTATGNKQKGEGFFSISYYDPDKDTDLYKDIAGNMFKHFDVGGLRVNSVSNYNNSNKDKLITRERYIYTDDKGHSTGTGAYDIDLEYQTERMSNGVLNGGGVPEICTYEHINTQAFSNSFTNTGSGTVYRRVTKVTEGVKNGKIVYYYNTAGSGVRARSFPFVPGILESKGVGECYKTEYYDSNNKLVRKEDVTYNTLASKSLILGIKAGVIRNAVSQDGEMENVKYRDYDVFRQSSFKPTERIVTDYLNDKEYKYRETYTYDNNSAYQISKTVIDDKLDQQVTSKTVYPDMITNGSADYHIPQSMIANNILRLPVKSLSYSDNNLTGASVVHYDEYGNVTDQFSRGVVFGDTDNTDNIDTDLYTKEEEYLYNENSRVKQVKNRSSVISIIWGYGNLYPVIKAEGVTFQELENKIESLGKDVLWIENNIKDNYPAVKSFVGQLRSNLPEATITLFSYKPQVGVTEITDPSGKSIKYNYDGFGRLLKVTDNNDKILKQYKYNYREGEYADNTANRRNTIMSVAEGDGTIYPSWSVKIPDGMSKRYDFKADQYREIRDIIVDGNSIKDSYDDDDNPISEETGYTFTDIASDHTIKVVYGIERYNICVGDNIYSNVAPLCNKIERGEDYQVQFEYTKGAYTLQGIKVNGTMVTDQGIYTLNNITENTSIIGMYNMAPITGTVRNQYSIVIPDVKVEIYKIESGVNVGDTEQIMETVYTDNSGRFAFTGNYSGTVNQHNSPVYVRVSKDNVSFSTHVILLTSEREYNFSGVMNGVSTYSLYLKKHLGTKNLNIIANKAWTITKNDQWINVSQSSGSGNATITVSGQPNLGSDTREGTFVVTIGTETFTIIVRQEVEGPPDFPDDKL